jgi:DNA-binding NarL/FixJ family response regulator
VLAWALDHDHALALRLAVALAPWWYLRSRSPGGYPLLRQAAGHAAPASDAWCAAQHWLGLMALYSADPAAALGHFTAVRDAVGDGPPSPVMADCLGGRSVALANLGRIAEAADDARRTLALARQLGYPAGEALALTALAQAAYYTGEFDGAMQLARQAGQIPADVPGWIARECSNYLTRALIEAGDLAAAERSCAAVLIRSRDAGDLGTLVAVLVDLADLDLRAGRIEDATARLRESLQIAARAGSQLGMDWFNGLDWCGYLCAATGRYAEAVTVWAARAALLRQSGSADPPIVVHRRDQPLDRARQALGDARARAAEDRGATMSMSAAAAYALMLTTPGPQPQLPPGLAKLSARERELVTLVAQGLTDAQIAAELFISVRTVSSHLDRIRDKTGCRRRADLTRLALTAGLV